MTTDESDIHTLLKDIVITLNKADIETLLSLHTEDIILMEQNMPLLQGKNQVREMFTAFEKRNCILKIDFKIHELEVIDRRASVRGAVIVDKTKWQCHIIQQGQIHLFIKQAG